MSSANKYDLTSQQLDAISTTVIATLLTGIIFSLLQNPDSQSNSNMLSWATAFGLTILLFHFLGFLCAHQAQIAIAYDNDKNKYFYGELAKWLNRLVHIGIIILFIFSILFVLVFI